MNFEMNLELLRDKAGNLRGFSIQPSPHTESETFCSTFPEALLKTRAGTDIVIKDARLHLIPPTCTYRGECSFPLNQTDEQEMNAFFELRGKFNGKSLSLKRLPFSLTGGFEISVAETQI